MSLFLLMMCLTPVDQPTSVIPLLTLDWTMHESPDICFPCSPWRQRPDGGSTGSGSSGGDGGSAGGNGDSGGNGGGTGGQTGLPGMEFLWQWERPRYLPRLWQRPLNLPRISWLPLWLFDF